MDLGEPREFPTTQWAKVFQATVADEEVAKAAQETLFRAYWYPLFAQARRMGLEIQDAEDITQECFSKLLSNRSLTNADPSKGRLRNYLSTAIQRLVFDHRAKESRRPLIFEADPPEGMVESDWTSILDRTWAATVLDRTQRRMDEELAEESDSEVPKKLFRLMLQQTGVQTYAEIGSHLGLSEGAVKMRIFRLRDRWHRRLREEVSKTVSQAEDVDDELNYLIRVMM